MTVMLFYFTYSLCTSTSISKFFLTYILSENTVPCTETEVGNSKFSVKVLKIKTADIDYSLKLLNVIKTTTYLINSIIIKK